MTITATPDGTSSHLEETSIQVQTESELVTTTIVEIETDSQVGGTMANVDQETTFSSQTIIPEQTSGMTLADILLRFTLQCSLQRKC